MKKIITSNYEEFIKVANELWEKGFTMPNGLDREKKTKGFKNPKTYETVTVCCPWWIL